MSYEESDLLAISALQHLAFCERQCALIHIEQTWGENRLTAEGRLLHERVHEIETESRGDLRIVRGLRLRSLELGLVGIADVVEFQRQELHQPGHAVRLPGVRGWWRPFPVEYKRGRPKPEPWDEVQLCAQSLCLEEMLGVAIAEGALFYGKTRRRQEVFLDDELRGDTERQAAALHDLIRSGVTPPAHYERRKCTNCSLFDLCQPKALRTARSARTFIAHQITGALYSETEEDWD